MYGIKKKKIDIHLFDPVQWVEDFEIFKKSVPQMSLELLESWQSCIRIFNSNTSFDARVMPEQMNMMGRRNDLLRIIENAIMIIKTIHNATNL